MSTLELSGFCHISQGESHLDDFQGNAVTTRGPNPTWKISLINPEHLIGSHIVTIALVTELGDPAAPLVLTLGEKVEEEGIQIVVAPLESPPSPRQMWTLEDVLPTKRLPPLVNARIQSHAIPEMSAGVGIMNAPLPMMYMNVTAVKNGLLGDDQRWRLDFVLQ